MRLFDGGIKYAAVDNRRLTFQTKDKLDQAIGLVWGQLIVRHVFVVAL